MLDQLMFLLIKNIRLDPLAVPKIVKSKKDSSEDDTVSTVPSTISDEDNLSDDICMPIIAPSNLVERTFLMPTDENRQCL